MIVHDDEFVGSIAEPKPQIVVLHDFQKSIPGYNNLTIALSLPDPDSFIRAAVDFVSGGKPALLMRVGIAKVHPDDKPNRKIGRQIAIKNMKSRQIGIESILSYRQIVAANIKVSKGLYVMVRYRYGKLTVQELMNSKNMDLIGKIEDAVALSLEQGG